MARDWQWEKELFWVLDGQWDMERVGGGRQEGQQERVKRGAVCGAGSWSLLSAAAIY